MGSKVNIWYSWHNFENEVQIFCFSTNSLTTVTLSISLSQYMGSIAPNVVHTFTRDAKLCNL